MKIWNIILKQDEEEIFDISCPANEQKLIVPINISTGNTALLSTSVFRDLSNGNIVPKNNAFDLLNIALGVYTIDQVISRTLYGYQGWSRHFKVYIPVNDWKIWNNIRGDFEKLLSFLSGDKWEIVFRQITVIRNIALPAQLNPKNIDTVSLFSGGLDSFIAAIDLLEDKRKMVLVSHYKNGSESPIQTLLHDILLKQYGATAFDKFKFYVQPNQKHSNVSKEDTSRARSFLFFALGLTIANSLGDNVEFIIPENGLISLNVPLTSTRLSSHSTRTTHPFYLLTFKTILAGIGIINPISNPYQFYTKGEMMTSCKNQQVLKSCYEKTLSCSHPDNSRFTKGQRPGIHCGYCVPCMIRRASEHKSNNNKTQYANQVKLNPISALKKSGRDLRAFNLAIERLSTLKKHNIVLELLNSGPLPFTDKKELDDYVSVYERGMKEVADFLK
jgi:7-cyano-7-deazaguanine synthase in queuosine biosynthesis